MSFGLLEAAAIIAVAALRTGVQDLGKTRLDDGKPSYRLPAQRFEGFDAEVAYPRTAGPIWMAWPPDSI